MLKKLFSTLILTLIAATLLGQTTKHSHYIGYDGGYSSGAGLSYRYQPNKWGCQVNLFPRMSNTETNLSLGLMFMRSIYQSTKIQFFLYYSNGVFISQDKYDYEYMYESSEEQYWATGFGSGFEVYIARRLSLNFRLGLAYTNEISGDNWQISPDGGIGLHFIF